MKWFASEKTLGEELVKLKKACPNAHMGGSEPFTYLHRIGVSAKSLVRYTKVDVRDGGAGYEFVVEQPDGEYAVFFISCGSLEHRRG